MSMTINNPSTIDADAFTVRRTVKASASMVDGSLMVMLMMVVLSRE